jgi:hypothetical protein
MRRAATLLGPILLLAASSGTPASAQDFWAHWGDGKAELNGYSLKQPRYGALRSGTAVLVFVTEDFSETLRVKAEPGRHPAADVFPVLKLNAVRDFATGIYDYNVMTSTFLRVAPGWPLAKLSFSSQEWCGHVWHQVVPRGGRLGGVLHSYFDGEADGSEDLDAPTDGVVEDALPVLLRGWNGTFLKPGESRSVAFLPSLLSARLSHRRLAWTRARIERAPTTRPLAVPAGRFEVSSYRVETQDGRVLSFDVEARPPYRLVRQAGPDGEELTLRGTARLPYWKLNGPGGERYLKDLGLAAR